MKIFKTHKKVFFILSYLLCYADAQQCTRCTHIRTLDLAIAYDNKYCALHGNNSATASTAVRNIITQVDTVFSQHTCLRISVGSIESHCNDSKDPYTNLYNFTNNILGSETQENSILRRFRTIWQTSSTAVALDATLLFLDLQLTSGVTGYAYTRGTCNSWGYLWVGMDFIPLTAHELGHSLSASHTTAGLMQGAVPLNDRSFSNVSVQSINSYASSPSGSCLASQACAPAPAA